MSTIPSSHGESQCALELDSRASLNAYTIMHTAPASHPYASIPADCTGSRSVGVTEPYHEQRGYLTNLQLVKFNQRFNSSSLTPANLVDEFALTYPLRGFQHDALHWLYRNDPKNLFAIRTVSTFVLYRLDLLACSGG